MPICRAGERDGDGGGRADRGQVGKQGRVASKPAGGELGERGGELAIQRGLGGVGNEERQAPLHLAEELQLLGVGRLELRLHRGELLAVGLLGHQGLLRALLLTGKVRCSEVSCCRVPFSSAAWSAA